MTDTQALLTEPGDDGAIGTTMWPSTVEMPMHGTTFLSVPAGLSRKGIAQSDYPMVASGFGAQRKDIAGSIANEMTNTTPVGSGDVRGSTRPLQSSDLSTSIGPNDEDKEKNDSESKMWVTERWHGVVERFDELLLTCSLKLEDEDSNRTIRLLGEIPMSRIEEDDRHLVDVGASFYLTIGTIPWNRKSRAQVTVLRFRRLPRWRTDHLQDLQERARKRFEAAADATTE
jgi:hypothetical protein